MEALKEQLAGLALTPEATAALLADHCRQAPELTKALRGHPRAYLEELGGRELPESLNIVIHDNSDHTWHLPLPNHRHQEGLSEEQLQQISAGEVLVKLAIIGAVATVTALVSVGVLAVATEGFKKIS